MPDFVVILLIIAGFLFYRFVICKGRMKLYPETIRMYSGTVGSGKTYNGVADALEAYDKQANRYKHRKNILWRIFCPDCKYPPTLYSNIPIKLGKVKNPETGKKEILWSEPLTADHFLIRKRFPKKAVIFIDEIGAFASQWDFDNPYVREQLQMLFRMFRQWTKGQMIMTDQAPGRVCKPIRELIGRVYWLYDFHRMWGILPFCEIYCIPLLMLEGETTATNVTQQIDQVQRIRRVLPYKWMTWTRVYDSEAWSELYDYPAEKECAAFDGFKTRYLIDLSVSANVMKLYKQNRDVFRAWFYQPRPWMLEQETEPDDIDGEPPKTPQDDEPSQRLMLSCSAP